MKFYVAIIDRGNDRAITGAYYTHAIDAFRAARSTCGYYATITAYSGSTIKKRIVRG